MLKITWSWSTPTSKKVRVDQDNCAPPVKEGPQESIRFQSVDETLTSYGYATDLRANLEEALALILEVHHELRYLKHGEYLVGNTLEKLQRCQKTLVLCSTHATLLRTNILQGMALGGQKTQSKGNG